MVSMALIFFRIAASLSLMVVLLLTALGTRTFRPSCQRTSSPFSMASAASSSVWAATTVTSGRAAPVALPSWGEPASRPAIRPQ